MVPAKQHCRFDQFGSILRQMGWIGSAVIAGSSKTAPRIFIFSIVLVAEYLSYVKSIATYTLTFFGYIISVLASVYFFSSMDPENQQQKDVHTCPLLNV